MEEGLGRIDGRLTSIVLVWVMLWSVGGLLAMRIGLWEWQLLVPRVLLLMLGIGLFELLL